MTTVDVIGEGVPEAKGQAHLMQVTRLVPLKGEGYRPRAAGEAKVDGKRAAGLLVRKEGRKDVTPFFDAGSGLLVKSERDVYDGYTETEAREERFYQGYSKKDTLSLGEGVPSALALVPGGLRQGGEQLAGVGPELRPRGPLLRRQFLQLPRLPDR
jgi:hypothetical protein